MREAVIGSNERSRLGAGALRVREGSLERELAAGSGRLRAIEPREERELLRVVAKALVRYAKRRSGKGVADFEVVLASVHLADVTPCRGSVVDERVVDQLADLVRPRVDVFDRLVEDTGIVVRADGVRLR